VDGTGSRSCLVEVFESSGLASSDSVNRYIVFIYIYIYIFNEKLLYCASWNFSE
jgi:hypothetical protein